MSIGLPYRRTVKHITASEEGGTYELNPNANDVVIVNLDQAITLTVAENVSDVNGTIDIILIQGATAYSVTWPAEFVDSSYVQTPTASTIGYATFAKNTAGNWYVGRGAAIPSGDTIVSTDILGLLNNRPGGDSGGATTAVAVDTSVLWTNTDSKLMSWSTGGLSKAWISKDGGFINNGTSGLTAFRANTGTRSYFGTTGAEAYLTDYTDSGTTYVRAVPGYYATTYRGNAAQLNIVEGIDAAGTLALRGIATDSALAVAVTISSTNTLATAGAKLLSIKNNSTEKLAVDLNGGVTSAAASGQTAFAASVAGARWYIGPTAYLSEASSQINTNGFSLNLGTGEFIGNYIRPQGTNPLDIYNYVADGASAVGTIIRNANNFTTTGSKLLSIRNNGTTEKAYFSYDGSLATASSALNLGTFTPALATAPSIVPGIKQKLQTGQTASLYLEGTGGVGVPSIVFFHPGTSQGWTIADGGDSGGFALAKYGEGATLMLQPGYPNAYIKTYVGATGQLDVQSHNGSAYQSNIALINDTIAVTATTLSLKGRMANGASAVGVITDTTTTYSTSGAKLISFRNNTTEKTYVDKDGQVFGGFGTANAAAVFLSGTLNVNTTSVGNVGAGEDDLITYSLPANSLVANGRGVRVTAWGSSANNANAKTLRAYFGSQTIGTGINLNTSVVVHWRVVFEVVRTGFGAQLYTVAYLGDNLAGTYVDVRYGTAAETETSAITIKCTGQATADNDIVQYGMIVEAI